MGRKNHTPGEARRIVFDTEDIADEAVAKSDPEKKSFWSRFALQAILSVNLNDDVEPMPLTEADVDEVTRGALARGLTPGGLDVPFDL